MRLEVHALRDAVEIAVQDGSSVLPDLRDPDDEGGRGLLILNGLADWGVQTIDGGKRVWARLPGGRSASRP
ncbi:MAG TPA: ATP-binding protein [Mycobacteriales bacterium]|nr:ATP-binding protein [Mycobacteriales bacterium]